MRNSFDSILTVAQGWVDSPYFDSETQAEVRSLISDDKQSELTDRFYRDLEFGTGGLRGIYGAGTAYVNPYTIRRASHALSLYLKEIYPNPASPLRIAISYDSRTHSHELAKTAASVFAAHGIQCYFAKRMKPVPLLSFAVRHFQCHAGICVTASHNPPAYHGYKVYWNTGAQVIPPHDAAIIKIYEQNQNYETIPFREFTDLEEGRDIIEFDKDLDEAYFKEVFNFRKHVEHPDQLPIVFTPLHGAGLHPVCDVLHRAGYKDLFVVPEQEQPDGRFPTVECPNPEDPKALAMAIQYAEKRKAELVLATDPDGDRIAIVFRNRSGELHTLNGNQIGCLLTYYVLLRMKEAGTLPENALMIKTIVTTDLQRKVAESFGCATFETLTGFKWICSLIEEYESGERQPYKQFVCGGEESYGFLAGTFVRDKDGVFSCLLACDMTAYFKQKGLRLDDVLDQLYQEFGSYREDLFTLTLPGKSGAEKISQMMDTFRSQQQEDLAGFKVVAKRDFLSGVSLPPSNVLQYDLSHENGWAARISVRPSGTEPKIKFYLSVDKPFESSEEDQKLLENAIKNLKQFFLDLI